MEKINLLLNVVDVFSLFRHYVFYSKQKKKKQSNSSEQTWIPFTQGCFLQNFVEIDQMVLGKNI